jgi:hypothetical protein
MVFSKASAPGIGRAVRMPGLFCHVAVPSNNQLWQGGDLCVYSRVCQ